MLLYRFYLTELSYRSFLRYIKTHFFLSGYLGIFDENKSAIIGSGAMDVLLGLALAFAVPLAVMTVRSFRILREYERAVMFTLGRFTGVRGPGLILMVPVIQQMVRIDLRTIVLDVPSQDVISRDNVSVKVSAVVYFQVVDPARAVIQVEDFHSATSQLAQTTLRSCLGKHQLDEMLAERDKLNSDIQGLLAANTQSWGIEVSLVEIKQVDIDPSMVRAIAQQAEAERARRAKVISAEGEQQAAAKLVEAARELAQEPGAMQLRYLTTLGDIAGERTSTIVFPVPIDIAKTLLGVSHAGLRAGGTGGDAGPTDVVQPLGRK
jgi:regulator of protease activity HflC (stomatin/prohibitin superfamily)